MLGLAGFVGVLLVIEIVSSRCDFPRWVIGRTRWVRRVGCGSGRVLQSDRSWKS